MSDVIITETENINKMKVVITGYNTCCLNHTGGVQVRVKKIYELLSQRNDIEVEFFSPMKTDFDSVDVLHIFKLEPEFYMLVKWAKSRGIKIVLSSIVPLHGGSKIKIYRYLINKLPILTAHKMSSEILNCVDAIVSETPEEKNFIAKYYGINSQKISVIPNGIDISNYDGREIFEKIRGVKDYTLVVGRFDSNKNQKNVIKALKGTDMDVVLIGGPDSVCSAYFEECKELTGNDTRFHYIGWVDNGSNLLKSAYAHAKVFVFPSYQETFGLVLLEAAIAGCNLAISKTLPIHGFHVFDDACLFDPTNVDDIRDKVTSAFSMPKSEIWKNRVIEKFAWSTVIDSHVKLYESLVK